MNNLAVVVQKRDVDSAIEVFQSHGVYDDSRRIREHDDDSIEIPVTQAPTSGPFTAITHQPDPDRRMTALDDYLAGAGWTPSEIDRAPNSWSVIGDVILVRVPDECPRPAEVGTALLALHGNAETVLARDGIVGEHREPTVSVLAGTGETETVHVEAGTKYKLDLAQVMFSPGNKAERIRMGTITTPDEHVIDLFAGIGYFTLPIARAGGCVTAIERNPIAFRLLVENGEFNGVQDEIRPIRGDCREVSRVLANSDHLSCADRIVMGYYDAIEYLDTALGLVRSEGMIHVHSVVPDSPEWGDLDARIESSAAEHGYSVCVLDRRRVKTHSPGLVHVVFDIQVTSP